MGGKNVFAQAVLWNAGVQASLELSPGVTLSVKTELSILRKF
jgi:hypothetical protein